MALQWSWIDGDMIRLPADAKSKKARALPIVGARGAVIERRKDMCRLAVRLFSSKRPAYPVIPQGLQSGRQGNRL
jgi:hypothetical protein